MPNISLRYLYNPRCVTNVVISRDSSASSTWWNLHLRSSLLNTVDPLKSWRTSSMVGISCLSLTIASLALRMFTQMRMSPSGLDTTTRSDNHVVGAFETSSMISFSSSSSSFFSTFSRRPNGKRRTGCAIGCTVLSTCSFPFWLVFVDSIYLCVS